MNERELQKAVNKIADIVARSIRNDPVLADEILSTLLLAEKQEEKERKLQEHPIIKSATGIYERWNAIDTMPEAGMILAWSRAARQDVDRLLTLLGILGSERILQKPPTYQSKVVHDSLKRGSFNKKQYGRGAHTSAGGSEEDYDALDALANRAREAGV